MINHIFIKLALTVFILLFPGVNVASDYEAYRYKLSVCAIFRDDAPYLKEWIEFHRLLGVEHFYLYNHHSRDDYLEVLDPYITDGIVDLIDWDYSFSSYNHRSWIDIQVGAYNDAIHKNLNISQWIAFIDTDEFLFSPSGFSLIDFLKDYEEFGGVCVCWRLFGTSHVSQISSNELMIEKLVLCGDLDYHVFHKSIVQTRYVDHFEHSHAAIYRPPYFHVDARKQKIEINSMRSQNHRDLIRINHYWTRDESYFYDIKLSCWKKRGWLTHHDIERANLLNKHYDNSIFKFIPDLRERMGLSR